MERNETIAALSTGRGGAIAVIRMSGSEAVAIAEKVVEKEIDAERQQALISSFIDGLGDAI